MRTRYWPKGGKRPPFLLQPGARPRCVNGEAKLPHRRSSSTAGSRLRTSLALRRCCLRRSHRSFTPIAAAGPALPRLGASLTPVRTSRARHARRRRLDSLQLGLWPSRLLPASLSAATAPPWPLLIGAAALLVSP
ncbi:hypothetical protein Sjap_005942 [Stephania japonica]|uniref:Uncharacterized protein n=1 Tax=Stephania japonica TaxID=461633 RepID=A0AAP0K6I5_9MAGN